MSWLKQLLEKTEDLLDSLIDKWANFIFGHEFVDKVSQMTDEELEHSLRKWAWVAAL